ncbi:MAG: alanine/glycine:cation symporter family protein [Emergencia sp.]|nr:alanine/glycine:cation symporter family protein [Emergencia sp.]
MALIESINSTINSFVWGVPMLVLLVGAGLLLTVRTAGVQFRKFGYAMKNTLGKIFKKSEAGAGEITPFQAMSTALAATVGTGNIAGITTAITLGGPGTIFWLWVTALIGMATKYSEVLLAVKYRERNAAGDWVGGPMYYIKNGLGKNWKWLGAIFCIFAALATFGIGNAVQVGNIVGSVNTVITSFDPSFDNQSLVNAGLGIVLMILVAIVLFGGIKRLGAVTEKLVPFMAVIYIVASMVVVVYYAKYIPGVFADIFAGAFSPEGVTGGAVGSIVLVITWGVKRGVFSNEAGLGSAPMAHAATSEVDPVKQGLYGIFEVFMDTIIICTLSGLTVLLAAKAGAIDFVIGVEGDTSLNAAALGTVFSDKGGAIIIAIALALFAFSTVLSWALYGTRCIEFLFGNRAVLPYQILFVAIIFVGATMKLDMAWAIADTLNGLMAIPNLIALVGLSGVVVSETKRHFAEKNKTKL